MKTIMLNATAIMLVLFLYKTSIAEEAGTNITNNTLTGKKWFVVELLQTKNDSTVNLAGVMHPCEKDNFTEFLPDGKYIVYEGESKCKAIDAEIKDEGEWELDTEANIFYETPSGGKEFEKKIVTINENEFIIEFTGLNNTTYTIKYLADEGYKNHLDAFKEDVKKDSTLLTSVQLPHRETLTNLVKNVVRTSKRFYLFEENDSTNNNSKLTFQKTIAVLPFADKAISAEKRNTQIASYKDIDYAITGYVLNTNFNREIEKATVEYNIDIWDFSTQKFITKTIKGTHSTGKILTRIGQVIGATALVAFGLRYGVYNPDLADLVPNRSYYRNNRNTTNVNTKTTDNEIDNSNAKIVADTVTDDNSTSNAYTTKNSKNEEQISYYFSGLDGDRNELLGLQGNLTKKAIEKTHNNVKNYFYNVMPVQFEITEILKIKKDGAPKQIQINGGSAADLKMLQALQIVQLIQNNKDENLQKEVLANALVGSVEGENSAKCRIVKQFVNFTELLSQPEIKIMVETK